MSRTRQKTGRKKQLWLVAEEGQAQTGLVADVAVEIRSPRLYSYAVPESLAGSLKPGVIVEVPYGRRHQTRRGICVRIAQRPLRHTLKPIADIVEPQPLLTPALLELGLWVSDFYLCPPGLTLAALVPAAARRKRRAEVTWVRRTASAAPEDLTAKQARLFTALAAGPQPRSAVLRETGLSTSVAETLDRQGLIETYSAPRPDADEATAPSGTPAFRPSAEDDFVLSEPQEAALQAVLAHAGQFRVFLLFGVPGSGKTEVYVRAIRRVIAEKRQAILLVPEIALATQVVERLARRFEHVAVMHSRLTDRTRRATLRAIARGEIDVVIGTRSAVFAPCPRLGLIVVDEEQDSSFKSLAAPLYHARDVAIKRAQLEQACVVLGSATPALETWHNAHTLPHYETLHLPARVGGASLPAVQSVRVAERALGQTATLLSEALQAQIARTLDQNQQAILLHNRRGYAVFLRCTRCGLVVKCPRCGSHLIFHSADSQMHCHRCSLREPVPESCLDVTCRGALQRTGFAIQKLEEELRRHFPAARLRRLDRDTMKRREDYAEALAAFEAGHADILIGTQMVAKGLDFPGVRLVGVIEADAALSLPDFRAAEQVFQLVMQVVGRAGRREGESVALVQSHDPAAPAVRHALRMDYTAFADDELPVRNKLFYPPHSRLVRLLLADERPGRARTEATEIARRLSERAAQSQPAIRVSNAAACAIARLRGMHRWQVLVRGPRDASVQRLLRSADDDKQLAPRVRRFTIDVDPTDLL